MATKKMAIKPEDVINIFSMRAGGATLDKIAEQYPFSTATVADVLYRRRDEHVPIPPRILEKVQSMHTPKKRRNTNPPVSAYSLLGSFTAACHEMNVAREKCIRAGLSADTLDLLRDSILEAEHSE